MSTKIHIQTNKYGCVTTLVRVSCLSKSMPESKKKNYRASYSNPLSLYSFNIMGN